MPCARGSAWPGAVLLLWIATACTARGGARVHWSPQRGTVSAHAEGRIGLVGELADRRPDVDSPRGWLIAPEFGVAVGSDDGDLRFRSSFALPSYKFMSRHWGAQIMVDFVADFGGRGSHRFGPELRLGVLRGLSRRDYTVRFAGVEVVAGHLFGPRGGWLLGLGGSVGHMDQTPRRLK